MSATYMPRYARSLDAITHLELVAEGFPLPAKIERMMMHVSSIETSKAEQATRRHDEAMMMATKARMGKRSGRWQPALTNAAGYHRMMQQGHYVRRETFLRSAERRVQQAKDLQTEYIVHRDTVFSGVMFWGRSSILEDHLNRHLRCMALVVLDLHKLYSFRLSGEELATVALLDELCTCTDWQDSRRAQAPRTLACASHKLRALADRMCEQLVVLLA